MPVRRTFAAIALSVAALAGLGQAVGAADDDADFYKGKQIRLVVSYRCGRRL